MMGWRWASLYAETCSVEEKDINSGHDGVGRKRHGERSYDL
jgi:hypothetical protein